MLHHFSSLDWTVFVLIQLATLAAVVYGHRRRAKSETEKASVLDYLLMGRKLTLPFFVATLVASWYGGIFGVTQISFEQGIYNFVTQGVFWYATYLFFAFFMVSRLRAHDAVTLPDLLRKLFGPRSAKLGAVFNFFNALPIAYAISMGIFLQSIFGGSLPVWIGAGTLFVMAYSLSGGFRAIVYSDLVQFVVMCGSVAAVVAFAYAAHGGMDYLHARLPASHFDWHGGENLYSVFAWGLIALGTLVDPSFYQRTLAAIDNRTAKIGILVSTLIWIAFDLCTTFGGMYARAAMPGADPKQGYLLFALDVLPSGWRGFFVAGAFATIVSTLDAFMNIASTTVSYDLLPLRLRQRKLTHVLAFGAVSLVTILISFLFEGSIKDTWKVMGGYAAGCLLLPVLIALFTKIKIADRTFVATALSAAVGMTIWRVFDPVDLVTLIDPLYVGVFISGIGILAGMPVDSLLPDDQRRR